MAQTTNRKPIASVSWGLVILLAVSAFLNYIDRGNLSLAAPLLKDELKISPYQVGLLLSAFFWTYGTSQVLAGWLVDRFNAAWILAIGIALWSGATVLTAFVHGFAALFAARLILGIGESVAYPSYSNLLARFVPEERRGTANSMISAGLALGPAFGTLAGGVVIARFGWRPFFVALGIIGFLWIVPWLVWMPRTKAGEPKENIPPVIRPRLLELLTKRSVWGTCAGLFCNNYTLYFLVTWLPYYLLRERNFSQIAMAKIGGGVFLMMAISALLAGRVGDYWIRRGGTPTRARKTFMALAGLFVGIFLLLCVIGGQAQCVVSLLLAGFFFGFGTANVWPITQTLAGPRAAGNWTGFQCFVANLSGVVAPAVTGYILQRTGHFFWAFAICSALLLLGSLAWVFWVGPIEQVQWRDSTEIPRLEAVAS